MFSTRDRRIAALILPGLLLLAAGARVVSAGERISTVAVFPVENLSGGLVPGDDLRQFLIGRLASAGISVLRTEVLEEFMARHRVRYAAGLDAQTAELLHQETGVEGVVVASIQLSSDVVPPKVALVARLVSITAAPVIVWADDAGISGDDRPGFFELGVVNDYQEVLTRALNRIAQSLLGYLQTEISTPPQKGASKFRPKSAFRGITLDSGRTYTVAVVPFVNLSGRRNAGDVLALLFIRHLASIPQFRVAEPGVVRRQLLDARIIMDGGLSLADADKVASLIDADFVVGGRVLRYEDYEGPAGRTSVEFSTVVIERRSRRVVWSSDSYNEGSDGVRFFERGTARTAHAMATQMVRLTADGIAGRDR